MTGTERTPPGALVGLCGITAVTFVSRVLLALQVDAPFMFHDEGGYVAVARLLTGDPPELFGPAYAPGYGVLLAPFAAFLEPDALHRAGQFLNAAAAAALVPVLYLLARRVARVRWPLALGLAAVGATSAASLVFPTMLLPESWFALATATAVLLAHHVLAHPSVRAAIGLGLVAGLADALHQRGLVVVGMAALALIAARVQRHLSSGIVIAAGAPMATVLLGSRLLHRWETDAVYPLDARTKGASELRALLDDPLGIAGVGLGHAWYLLFATAGLAVVGVVALVRVGVTEWRRPAGILAGSLLVAIAVSVVLSAVATKGLASGVTDRADKPVYGRYVEQWLPVLVAVAPAIGRRWLRAAVPLAALGSLGAGALLHWRYDSRSWLLPTAWHNIPSLRVVYDSAAGFPVVRAAGFAAVAVVVLWLPALFLRHRVGWWIVLAVVLAANVLSGWAIVDRWAEPGAKHWARGRVLGREVDTRDRPVAIDAFRPGTIFYAYNLQFWFPDVDVELTRGTPSFTDAPLVITPSGAPPEGAGPALAIDDRFGMSLWAPAGQ